MSGILNLDLGSIIKGVGDVIDDLHTSDEERLKISLQEKMIDAELAKGQLEINKAEALHKRILVAGWRPFLGWVGGVALAYKFIVHPLIVWFWVFGHGQGWIPLGLDAPPSVNAGELYPIILCMLGVGGMRSYDKLKGTNTK